jgi:hypothetical protein
MNLRLQLLFVVFGLFMNAESSLAAQFWCRDVTSNQWIEVGPESRDFACVTDLVWGSKNVCFNGQASDLVESINNAEFSWVNEGLIMREASVNDTENVIRFVGYIQKDFFSGLFDIERCPEDFIK